jgi:hypothetical protein
LTFLPLLLLHTHTQLRRIVHSFLIHHTPFCWPRYKPSFSDSTVAIPSLPQPFLAYSSAVPPAPCRSFTPAVWARLPFNPHRHRHRPGTTQLQAHPACKTSLAEREDKNRKRPQRSVPNRSCHDAPAPPSVGSYKRRLPFPAPNAPFPDNHQEFRLPLPRLGLTLKA